MFKLWSKQKKILYKYTSPNLIEAFLKDKTIAFSNYTILNDPYETSIENTLDYMKRQFKKPPKLTQSVVMVKVGNFPIDAINPYAHENKQKEEKENIHIKEFNSNLNKKISTLKRARTELGILSLTTNPLNNLMWSHYAKNHSGVCLGFDMTHPFFLPIYNSNYSSRLLSLKKIKYLKYRHKYKKVSSEKYIERAFFSKHKSWSYENEYRILKPILNKRIIQIEKFPISILKEIYIGVNTSKNDLRKIQDAVFGEKIKIYKVKQEGDNYKLIKTVNI